MLRCGQPYLRDDRVDECEYAVEECLPAAASDRLESYCKISRLVRIEAECDVEARLCIVEKCLRGTSELDGKKEVLMERPSSTYYRVGKVFPVDCCEAFLDGGTGQVTTHGDLCRDMDR